MNDMKENNLQPGAPMGTADSSKPLQLDLKAVVDSKLGKKARFVPGFLIKCLEKVIRVKDLNELLAHNHPRQGAEFCRGVLEDLDVTLEVRGLENLPSPDNKKVVIASNHPLGGLDGMALIKIFTEYYGGKVHFLVNDILMAVKPLNDVFVPVNKHGAQSRATMKEIDRLFEADEPILVFPAGLVSRLGKNGEIKDLEWKKMFVNKAISSQRDIIPVHFSGYNSQFFYKFARRRKRLGLKFNIEMIYLPGEVFSSKGKKFIVTVGKPISWQSLKGGKDAQATAAAIKDIVYKLAD